MVITANVGRDILTAIRNYGVDTVFGIPGTHNLEFYRHLPELGMRYITTRHEQGAGFGADGWSLQTGLPGVVITTSGPGLLNALGSVANAYAESRPLIVLTPGAPLGEEFADIGSLHETKNTQAAADAVSEWARRVRSGEEAVQAVHDAFALFRTGRPRPVVIEVPLNILEGESDCPEALLAAKPEPALPQPDATELGARALEEATALLADADRPVILAGGGSVAASADVLELATRLDAPVVTTLNGRGVIPESHPLAVGASLRLKAAHRLVNEADVILAIGTKVGEAELWWGPFEPTGKVIRVDRLESQLNKNLAATVAILGDSRAVVPALTARVEAAPANPSRASGAEIAAGYRREIEAESREWSPAIARLCDAIAAGVPEDVIIGADSSQVSYYGTASHVPVNAPNSYLYMATFATLGYGLPASIGAKIGAPERPVVAVIGDGALMFSIQELVTAREENLDLVVLCVDNGGYREIEENEADRGIDPIGVRLTQPNWPQLAAGFGWIGATATTDDEVTQSIQDALAEGGLHFIHVPFAGFNADASTQAQTTQAETTDSKETDAS